MKQLLCVVDFSDSTAKVLEIAGRIASGYKAHLVVLFPYRLIDYAYRGDITALKLRLESEAKEKFQELKKNIPALQNVSCEFQPEIGFIFDRITSNLKKNKTEMIIIGQQQTVTINDLKGVSLQNLISGSKLPFVIVPEVKSPEAVLE
ncbi:MAG TPA: universal stress protein [Chryseosolibacter sp.]